jgi:hypothetical protein
VPFPFDVCGKPTETATETTRPDQDIVVELGYGGRTDNLIALADRYPDARIYGVDNAVNVNMSRLSIPLGYRDRIQLIDADYTSYRGALQNNADVVVSVSPLPGSAIDQGIERLIKPGGSVLVLVAFSDQGLRDELKHKYETKPGFQLQQLSLDPYALEHSWGGRTVHTAIGVPISSMHFNSGENPWQLYIPTW